MNIGEVIYGCDGDIDIFTEKTGYKKFCIRLRHAESGELLDKKVIIDYSLPEALAVAKFMAKSYKETAA